VWNYIEPTRDSIRLKPREESDKKGEAAMKSLRIASGSAFWGDMLDPAVELAEKGNLKYIGFDHLAELTLAIMQRIKTKDPKKGYIDDIVAWTRTLLPITSKKGIKMISNAGAANPESAADEVVKIAKELGLTGMKIGVVTGDSIAEHMDEIRAKGWKFKNLDTGEEDIDRIKDKIVAANAYIGADCIIECLKEGADMVVTGRVSDNTLYVGPIMYEMGWDYSSKYTDLVAAAVTIGHIIECSMMCCGGGSNLWKVVKNSWRPGFPIAEVYENGEAVITKVEGSGGLVNEWTVKEHLVYEVHDPSNYLMPDGIADFTSLKLEELGKNKVKVSGIKGKPRPQTLKVCIGYSDGYIGEGHIFFSWPDAMAKAKRAEQWIRDRIKYLGLKLDELRIDYFGINMLHGKAAPWPSEDIDWNEMGLRITAKTKTRDEADAIRREVTHLWTAGPVSASFGVPFAPRPVVSLWPTLVPTDEVKPQASIKEVK